MSGEPGRQLLDVLQRELISGLHDAVSSVLGSLDALTVDSTFDDTAFAGRVLAPVDTANPVLDVVRRFTHTDAGEAEARLCGWRDESAEGSPRGAAYVLRSGSAVAALTVVPAAGARLVLRAAGFGAGQSIEVAFAEGVTLSAAGTTSGSIDVAFFPDQPPSPLTLSAHDRIELSFRRQPRDGLIGLEGGPSVRFGAVSADGWVGSTDAQPFDRGVRLRVEGGEVALAPGFFRGLLPVDLTFPVDLDLNAAPDVGVVLGGSPSLRTRLTEADGGRALDLALDVVDTGGGAALRASFQTAVSASLPGAPVDLHVDGIGLSMPLSLRLGTPLLPDPAGVQGVDPTGAGVALDLPVLSGSGAFAKIGDDLSGAIAVSIPPMAVSAFGVLSPERDGRPLSLLVIMGATFPPPGVQVGFGFAISGVGGVVGINRRIDHEALLRAVTDGSAAQMLFPSDPVGAGQAAIRALPTVFPAARGSVVAGPMFQLSWGGRIVTLSVAVLVESATQTRLTIMGKLVVALPDPAAPLVLLQATFAGDIDAAEPSVLFVASLNGSHIVGAALSGDIVLLSRGGAEPTFILSAGGFHPAFPLPRGVPALKRMSMDMCPAPWIDMRCESYFAVTSNTLQLGARLELVAEVADCGLRGWLAFDALVQYEPFKFVADVSGGIALEAFGESLVGIALALHLEGPSPYLARGRGSIDLFLFDVSFDFDVSWGQPAVVLHGADVGAALRAELARPQSWRPRGSAPRGLVLTVTAQKALGDAALVDPYGAVSVRQERVPLGIELQRFNGISVDAQRWDLQNGEFGEQHPAAVQNDITAQFAPGQFLAGKSDDEALTAPAFLQLKSGVELLPTPAASAEARVADLQWEERLIALDIPMPQPVGIGLVFDVAILEAVLTAMSTQEEGWWPRPEEVVTVEPVAPVTTAFSWSMAPGPTAVAANALELAGAVSGELMTVEAWEIAG